MIKHFLFFILFFVCTCFSQQTFYLSTNGNDTNTCLSSDNPCHTLQGIVAKSSAFSSIEILISPGIYSGKRNIDIDFPAYLELSLINIDASTHVIFYGSGSSACFNVVANFEMNGLSLSNCGTGVQSNTNIRANVVISNSSFANCNNAIFHQSNKLVVVNVTINTCYTNGIFVSHASEILIDSCSFSKVYDTSINFSITSGLETIEIVNCFFNYTTGLYLKISQESGTKCLIDNCTFTNVNSPTVDNDYYTDHLIFLNGGNWTLNNLYFNPNSNFNCFSVITFAPSTGKGNLIVSDTYISNTCYNGIQFEGQDSFGLFNSIIEAVEVFSASGGYTIMSNCNITGEIQAFALIETNILLENSILTNIQESLLKVTPKSNITINNCYFTNSIASSLSISSGICVINDVLFHSFANNITGSVLSFSSSSIYINNSTFSNCSTHLNGGVIYADNSKLVIENSEFINNIAEYGGALYLKNTTSILNQCRFSNNIGRRNGGAINVEASNSPETLTMTNIMFDNNTATNGAVMSCCDINSNNCEVTVYTIQNTLTYIDNTNSNTNGDIINCNTIDQSKFTISATPKPSPSKFANIGCCSAHSNPGCYDENIQNCVCNENPSCCSTAWTEDCVNYVTLSGCGDCNTGSCCVPHSEPGCIDRATESCVCQVNSSCCSSAWDENCVEMVRSLSCGGCINEDSCFQVHNTPGCRINSIEQCVCSFDTYCCDGTWDSVCVDQAITNCLPNL